MTRHLFLIGFMGSGKSYQGRRLAEKLGCPFIDLDAFIVTSEGKSIADIFFESGETGFRVLESDHLRRLAALPPAVVATGGGTPCFFDNLDWMKRHGLTVYLRTAPDVLFERLRGGKAHRPLLRDLDDEGLRDFIRERLAARESYYLQADATLEWGQADVAGALEQMASG